MTGTTKSHVLGLEPHPSGARQWAPRHLLIAGLIALGALSTATMASAHGRIDPPPVPANLEVPTGHRAYLITRAYGTQNQICLPNASSSTGLAWSFFGPQATGFDARDGQVLTHYLSANPDEAGAARPTWQHSKDTSAVWAQVVASSLDPDYVEAGAIPWLLLQIVGAEEGPTGGDKLTATTYIQRVATVGGVVVSPECYVLGAKLLVPYEADYVFYRAR